MKTIKISDKNWEKLMKIKLEHGYKNVDDIIEEMFNMITKKRGKLENDR